MDLGMKAGFFEAADGLKLYAEWYPRTTPDRRAVAVVAHGYSDHCGRHATVGRTLADAGLDVMTFDFRGHGQAGGHRGHIERFDEYLADLGSACDHAAAVAGERPALLVGHSQGALVILRMLCDPARAPAGVRAAALSSPFLGLSMKVPLTKRALATLASWTVPRLTMKSDLTGALMSHEPEMIAAYDADRFCHKVATARWFTETLAAQAYVRLNAARITLPTLWLVGGNDPLADAQMSRTVYERAGGDKQLRVYDGCFHELFGETQRARVFRDLVEWVSARFPAA